jgi:hypothetical protein
MSWGLMYYFLSLVTPIIMICVLLNITMSITAFATTVFTFLEKSASGESDLFKSLIKIRNFSLIVLCISSFFSIVIPEKKDVIIIFGLNSAQAPITNAVNEYSPKLKQLFDKELGKLLKDDKE